MDHAEQQRLKLAYLLARTHAATWAGTGPVDETLVEDLLAGILRAQAEQGQAEPPAQAGAPTAGEGASGA